MNPNLRFSRTAACVVLLGAALLGGGCTSLFTAKHKVLVDAIAAPEVTRPDGESYRLIAQPSMVGGSQVNVAVVKACLDAALNSVGMYEAPPNVPPDLYIEVNYGTLTSPRGDPAGRETFLQLSSRSNPGRSLEKATGTELWDVRVGVLGIVDRIETAMPLLSSVAVDYIGTDTEMETEIEVLGKSPAVESVRQTAIRALEARAVPTGVLAPRRGGSSDRAIEPAVISPPGA